MKPRLSTKRDSIGTRERRTRASTRMTNHLRKGSAISPRGGSWLPSLLLSGKKTPELRSPVRATATPKVEEHFEQITFKRTEPSNGKPNSLRGNRKPEDPVPQLNSIEAGSISAQRCLKQTTHRERGELKLAATKGGDQNERVEGGGGNWKSQGGTNLILEPQTRQERKPREGHGGEEEDLLRPEAGKGEHRRPRGTRGLAAHRGRGRGESESHPFPSCRDRFFIRR